MFAHHQKSQLTDWLPMLTWLKNYTRQDFNSDLLAGIITAILLVPQGIAYAILAGLPVQLGLYASIIPTICYALLGSSRTLSVGPVAVAAIMIASALKTPELIALGNPAESAVILSAETGLIMLVMALLRMGGLVNFISHPVLTGFTSGAAILIIVSQLPQFLGLTAPACSLTFDCYADYFSHANLITLALGLGAFSTLFFFQKLLPYLLNLMAFKPNMINAISKCGPLMTVILATIAVSQFNLTAQHVAVVGQIPAGFPDINIHFGNFEKWRLLLTSSAFIALIAYVESVAIAKVVANLRSEKIAPNQELIALGLANIASSFSGGMPVAGGFSRTMVNFSAGARTQMAMLIAGSLLAVAVMFVSQWFTNIPKASLAAIIVIAIIPLVKLKNIIQTWHYDRGDGIAEVITLLGVVSLGIEKGITLGIVLTIASHLRKTSQPHIAVVGRIANTEHFRNIKRHQVQTWQHILLLRIDESITFANVNYIEEFLTKELIRQPNTSHIVLILTSVNDIDSTALDALEMLNASLKTANITLNLSEVKGPVLDKLEKTDFLKQLSPGKVFFRTQDAVNTLS